MIHSGDCFCSGFGNTWQIESIDAGFARCARVAVLGAPQYDNAGTPHDLRAIAPRILDESPLYLLGYAAWGTGRTPNPYPVGTLAARGWDDGYYAAEADGVAYAERDRS